MLATLLSINAVAFSSCPSFSTADRIFVFLPSWSRIKARESGFPYCFLTDFTKFFLWGIMLLDFGFLTEKASLMHRIFEIWCDDEKKLKNSNSSKILRPRPILAKLGIRNHLLLLVHSHTKLQLDNSKFALLRQFWKNFQKIQNFKKFDRSNRF